MRVFHDEKTVGNLAKTTRSQAQKSEATTENDDKVVGRAAKLSDKRSSYFEATFINNNEFYSATGWADAGFDESVVSSQKRRNFPS